MADAEASAEEEPAGSGAEVAVGSVEVTEAEGAGSGAVWVVVDAAVGDVVGAEVEAEAGEGASQRDDRLNAGCDGGDCGSLPWTPPSSCA